MRVIRSAKRMAAVSERLQRQGRRIGFVPTMGALHEGHSSLIRAAAASSDVVIVSIFVNPMQFGPREDLARYPRPLQQDLRFARRAGADIAFVPSVQDIYPRGFATSVDPGWLARRWEGQARPGHFRGVATVVTILFELTRPTVAYFGQKDYQQVRVVQQLVRDLRLPVRIRLCPTVREPDGLAMSSRNVYLTPRQRHDALVLVRSLRAARALIRRGERRASSVQAAMRQMIRATAGARVEYAAAVDASTLEPVKRLRGRIALLVAARVGSTRLIDNLLVDVP
ncbi:MAG: pantoate--beta-alanine ligase [Candidatus Omnitrophica bacterium CG11_big_fil_rev_8_21_14_0_20_63_9]|nr:MAG: pantoate--beta-alanine ligase [Candidatus Omnitrophica bacterium CG11_big_fil_rev_8_21_14_0_20_63_9]